MIFIKFCVYINAAKTKEKDSKIQYENLINRRKRKKVLMPYLCRMSLKSREKKK